VTPETLPQFAVKELDLILVAAAAVGATGGATNVVSIMVLDQPEVPFM
jgi:hypothetical protein